MAYHPSLGRFTQRDPVAYLEGMNLLEFERSNPAARLDPSGLQATKPTTQGSKTWYGELGCENECEGAVDAIYNTLTVLPTGGRLAKAREVSKIENLIMLVIAYKESKFDPTVKNPTSTATGLFQIRKPTADDIQDRIWPKFINPDNPIVPAGKRLADMRTEAIPSAQAAYVYLLDRIAAAGNSLTEGLNNFGTGKGYSDKIMAGLKGLKDVCGFKPKQEITYEGIKDCAKKHCEALKDAMEKVVR